MANQGSGHPLLWSAAGVAEGENEPAQDPDCAEDCTDDGVDQSGDDHHDLHRGPDLQGVLVCALGTVVVECVFVVRGQVQRWVFNTVQLTRFRNKVHHVNVHEVRYSDHQDYPSEVLRDC